MESFSYMSSFYICPLYCRSISLIFVIGIIFQSIIIKIATTEIYSEINIRSSRSTIDILNNIAHIPIYEAFDNKFLGITFFFFMFCIPSCVNQSWSSTSSCSFITINKLFYFCYFFQTLLYHPHESHGINGGVAQGSLLVPTFFRFHINNQRKNIFWSLVNTKRNKQAHFPIEKKRVFG